MVSVEFAGVTIAILLLYLFLWDDKIRWRRMAGQFGIMICAIGLGVVGDNIPMFILMSVNLMIAILAMIKEVSEIIEDV